jgi:hypothetical protein
VQKEEEVAAIDYDRRNGTIAENRGGTGGELMTPSVMQGMTATMVSADLDNLLVYFDHNSIKKSLLRWNWNSILQAHLNWLKGQVSNSYIIWGCTKLCLRLKAATLALKPHLDLQNLESMEVR